MPDPSSSSSSSSPSGSFSSTQPSSSSAPSSSGGGSSSSSGTPPTSSGGRAPRGFIHQHLEDAITLATDCHHEAGKTDVAAKLLEREWTAADQTALAESIARCEDYKVRIRDARAGKLESTDDEEAARRALIIGLDPVLKGARRTYPDGSSQRHAFGIGANLANSATQTLIDLATFADSQLSEGEGGAPPAVVLKGVLPAEIAAISALATQYRNADFTQGDAQTTASQLLAELKVEVETVLNPARRDLQGAADQSYTHRDPVNAAQRTAFALQPDRPLQD